MNTSPLFRAMLAYGPDALRCLFTEVRPTRQVLLANLAAGWSAYPEAALAGAFDELLAAGYVEPMPSDRTRYRLALDVPKRSELWARLTEPVATDSRRITDAEPAAPAPTTGIEPEPPAAPRFSYYRGGIGTTTPYAAITPAQLHTVLTSPQHRARTEALRAAPVGSSQRDALKRSLDYVTPAGTFARRANNGLETASGLLVLDFDHLPDVAAARAALLADALLAPELVLLFTSPSGDGLKALINTDPRAAHLDNFRAYAAYLAAHYAPLGLRPDEAGKDVARACFVPYAPDAWLAPTYTSAA